jgi:hypothetical protein
MGGTSGSNGIVLLTWIFTGIIGLVLAIVHPATIRPVKAAMA